MSAFPSQPKKVFKQCWTQLFSKKLCGNASILFVFCSKGSKLYVFFYIKLIHNPQTQLWCSLHWYNCNWSHSSQTTSSIYSIPLFAHLHQNILYSQELLATTGRGHSLLQLWYPTTGLGWLASDPRQIAYRVSKMHGIWFEHCSVQEPLSASIFLWPTEFFVHHNLKVCCFEITGFSPWVKRLLSSRTSKRAF